MKPIIRQTDRRGRLTLPSDYANCLVTIERLGKELRVRKTKRMVAGRYSFKQLMAGVTGKNKHTEVKTGPMVGRETL